MMTFMQWLKHREKSEQQPTQPQTPDTRETRSNTQLKLKTEQKFIIYSTFAWHLPSP